MLSELALLGLSEKQARIYMAAIQLGSATVAQLAEKSGVKRPTVYAQLEEMTANGFVDKLKLNKKTFYRPKDPVLFEKNLAQKNEVIQKLKQEYAVFKTASGQPQVTVYDGLENIKPVYEEIGNANFARFWSNVGEIHPLLSKQFLVLCEQFKKNGTNVREIVANTKESKRYSRYIRHVVGPIYSSRAASIEGVENDTAVTNNALYIFRLHEFNFFAVRIEDQTIASTYRALFDMAWKQAEPF